MYNLADNSGKIMFGARLSEARRNKGLTQEKASEALGIGRSTIAGWESGAHLPEMDKISAICALYGCDIGFLCSEYNEPTFDMHQICEYTHLLPSAAEKMKHPYVYNFINALLENGLEEDLLVIHQFSDRAANKVVLSDRMEELKKQQSFYSGKKDVDISPTEEWYVEQIVKKLKSVHMAAKEIYNNAKYLKSKIISQFQPFANSIEGEP